MHLIPPPPQKKKLHNLLFSFLLGITAVLRDIENNACKKFEGVGQISCLIAGYIYPRFKTEAWGNSSVWI